MSTVTVDEYYRATMQLLASEGFKGVTIAALGRTLGVTSGSFYHHFGSLDGFLEQFLERWEAQETQRIIDLTRSHGEPSERLGVLLALATEVPHSAEAALRAWANTSGTVRRAQDRIDDRRLAFLDEVLKPLVVDPEERRIVAGLTFSSFVGVQQLQDHLGPELTRGILREVERAIAAPRPASARVVAKRRASGGRA